MTDTTPKQRYDARQKLKRMALNSEHKADQILTEEYLFDLAGRFVTALETIADAMSQEEAK